MSAFTLGFYERDTTVHHTTSGDGYILFGLDAFGVGPPVSLEVLLVNAESGDELRYVGQEEWTWSNDALLIRSCVDANQAMTKVKFLASTDGERTIRVRMWRAERYYEPPNTGWKTGDITHDAHILNLDTLYAVGEREDGSSILLTKSINGTSSVETFDVATLDKAGKATTSPLIAIGPAKGRQGLVAIGIGQRFYWEPDNEEYVPFYNYYDEAKESYDKLMPGSVGMFPWDNRSS